MSDEPPSIASLDWRLQAITTLAEDFKCPWTGTIHETGSPVELVRFVQHGRKHQLAMIPVPNAPAIYLSLAQKAAEAGSRFVSQQFSKHLKSLPDGNERFSLDAESELFDAFENMIACIVFSYTAIETFANQTIPDDFEFEQERSDRRCRETYSKDQIERFISLDVKMDAILPSICSVPSPKGTGVWNNYVWLKRLRDRLIHLKSSDCRNSDPENAEDFVWTWLLSSKVPKAPKFVLSLIEHYYPDKKPRWIRRFP